MLEIIADQATCTRSGSCRLSPGPGFTFDGVLLGSIIFACGGVTRDQVIGSISMARQSVTCGFLDTASNAVSIIPIDPNTLVFDAGLQTMICDGSTFQGSTIDLCQSNLVGTVIPSVTAQQRSPLRSSLIGTLENPPVPQPVPRPVPRPVPAPRPVTSPPPLSAPDNNTCRTAEDIRFISRTRTNDGASIDSAPSCNGESVDGPGVWFTIDGSSGDRFTAETCSTLTDFDTKITVYRGSCSRLVCVTANDDHDSESSCSSSTHSHVTWDTESGETYYILVHGYDSDDFGRFNLDLGRSSSPVAPVPTPRPVTQPIPQPVPRPEPVPQREPVPVSSPVTNPVSSPISKPTSSPFVPGGIVAVEGVVESSNVPAIIGSIVGVLLFLGCIAGGGVLVFCCWKKKEQNNGDYETHNQNGDSVTVKAVSEEVPATPVKVSSPQDPYPPKAPFR